MLLGLGCSKGNQLESWPHFPELQHIILSVRCPDSRPQMTWMQMHQVENLQLGDQDYSPINQPIICHHVYITYVTWSASALFNQWGLLSIWDLSQVRLCQFLITITYFLHRILGYINCQYSIVFLYELFPICSYFLQLLLSYFLLFSLRSSSVIIFCMSFLSSSEVRFGVCQYISSLRIAHHPQYLFQQSM